MEEFLVRLIVSATLSAAAVLAGGAALGYAVFYLGKWIMVMTS